MITTDSELVYLTLCLFTAQFPLLLIIIIIIHEFRRDASLETKLQGRCYSILILPTHSEDVHCRMSCPGWLIRCQDDVKAAETLRTTAANCTLIHSLHQVVCVFDTC